MRRAEGLSVVVAQTSQIYNEFSGGVPDMRAVRDHFRFLYDRGTTDSETLRYGLLFGDGHYDFRGLAQREGSLQNWVFPFETDESLRMESLIPSGANRLFGGPMVPPSTSRTGSCARAALAEPAPEGVGASVNKLPCSTPFREVVP